MRSQVSENASDRFAMGLNEYHIVTRWRVPGTVEEAAEVLADAADLPRWWPSVYLAAEELKPGDGNGLGREIALYTKGWLPYTLRWQFRVSESHYPHGFALEAWGDLVGRGEWSLKQDGGWVDITYDWRLRAEKPLLRQLSFILHPVFAANHRWAMARGEESLRRELARRAASEEERAHLPPPPKSTGWGTFLLHPMMVIVAAVALLSTWLFV